MAASYLAPWFLSMGRRLLGSAAAAEGDGVDSDPSGANNNATALDGVTVAVGCPSTGVAAAASDVDSNATGADNGVGVSARCTAA